MSKMGLGVMIGMLGGNRETSEAISASLNKKIRSVRMQDESLILEMEHGTLRLWDDGQSCCENRYMTCDDDLVGYEGATLVDVTVQDAPHALPEYDECHEVQFLHVKTDRGTIVAETHNEHNGYYGGFWVQATLTEAA